MSASSGGGGKPRASRPAAGDNGAKPRGESRGGAGGEDPAGEDRLQGWLGRPWRDYLARKKLKISWAREVVVETFLSMRGHIELHQLHEQVKRKHPGIGLATVYRTVKLMQEAGVLQSRHFSERGAVYELVVGREHHDHLICEGCGQIVEFSDDDVERIQDDIARDHGFVLVRHRHELFGLCAICRPRASVKPA